MLSASADPKAVRIYHQAGFELHPQMYFTGTFDRTTIPVVEKVREGSAADIDLMDSLDRAARGAGHGPDHELMLGTWRLLVSDTTTGSGYAYLNERGQLALLAASNRRTATRLLWAALADGPEQVTLHHVTGAEPVGARRRVRRPAGAAPGGLPRAARDEAAHAVRSQRCPAVTALPRE